ncbi:MAG: radical SAM protein [Candidatus Bathyarchaeota archaeon]|nr:radical SAM protein [Candidatus Bathyarchaeota archaeon]
MGGFAEISVENLEAKVLRARELSWSTFGRKIRFYAPSFAHYHNKYFRSSRTTFPSISITGNFCSLNCGHCGAKILETMIPVQTPNELIEACTKIKEAGADGCLISGGCLPDGSVPIGRFVDAVAEIKRSLGLTVVAHTGLINVEAARRLKEVGVDAVSIDIIGSDETIREVYNLDASVRDYEESLKALEAAGMPFTPHVLVGLHYGDLRGEVDALKMIGKHGPSALILIAFFPVRGTLMENVTPPSPETIIEVLVQARLMMPKVPLVLGCARPKGEHRKKTDVLAVEAGVNAIAFPSIEAVERAGELGLETSFSSLCCSQIYEQI